MLLYHGVAGVNRPLTVTSNYIIDKLNMNSSGVFWAEQLFHLWTFCLWSFTILRNPVASYLAKKPVCIYFSENFLCHENVSKQFSTRSQYSKSSRTIVRLFFQLNKIYFQLHQAQLDGSLRCNMRSKRLERRDTFRPRYREMNLVPDSPEIGKRSS